MNSCFLPGWVMAGCVSIAACAMTNCVVFKPVQAVTTTPNKPYHLEQNPAPGVPDVGPNARLRVVELDDQGELWSHKQLTGVVDDIRGCKAPEGVMLLVFVHGWNNDASNGKGGGNLAAFAGTVSALGDAMQLRPPGRRQKVFGVFVGWRGRTFEPAAVFLDYFHRRAAAQRVGGPSGTQTLMALLEAGRGGKNTRIVIGHSFGGLIVERALAPVIMTDIARSPGGEVKPLADLVLLINEAENSLVAHQLVTAMKNRQNLRYVSPGKVYGGETGGPLIVSVASRNDHIATRGLLPVGAFVGRYLTSLTNTTNSGKLRPPPEAGGWSAEDGYEKGGMSQRDALMRAPAHMKDLLRSHHILMPLCPGRCPCSRPCSRPCQFAWTAPEKHEQKAREYLAMIERNQHPLQADGTIHIAGANAKYLLEPKKDVKADGKRGRWNDTPCWIFRVREEFISSHNGLWDEGAASANTIALISALTALSEKPSSEP